MVNVYIQDSGRVSVPYDATETQFPVFSSSTQTQKREGEFRVSDVITMKLDNFNFILGNNEQTTGGATDLRSIIQKTGMNPIGLNLTCHIDKPRNNFTGSDTKDLPVIINYVLQSISNGYKQFWISDTTTSRESLFSLYYFITTFGVNDGSTTSGTTDTSDSNLKKHLKVTLGSFNYQEGVDEVSFNITLNILWDL